MDAGVLFQGLFFGVIGSAYFIYGKKQQNLAFLTTGLGLILTPYFIENFFFLVICIQLLDNSIAFNPTD
jgi:hypothetical protein